MPHAINMPSTGIQAIILCGPGVSLNTFTSKPEEFPKALVPIANRPMVWYPLEWCYRMGVTCKCIECCQEVLFQELGDYGLSPLFLCLKIQAACIQLSYL